MADINTDSNGDLVLSGGITIALDEDRDRYIVLSRILTVQGDYDPNLAFGVSSRTIGKDITGDLLQQIEEDVKESLGRSLGAHLLGAIVRAVPTGLHEITVLVQIEKTYTDAPTAKRTVMGSFWHRDEPITLLDGTEG